MTYRPDSSASDSITAQIIEEEEDPYSGTTDGLSYATAQDGAAERSSVYSQNSQHQPQQENMQQHQQQQQQYAQSQYPPQYQDPNYAAQQQQWQQQQQQQHPQQQQQQYDNYYGYQQYDQYAGAQDLPPGANQQYPGQMNSPYQSRSPYAQSVRSFSSSQSAPSMAPSMSMPPPSSYATSEYSHQQSETDGNDEEFAPRPSANREVTGVPSMRIANVKAVDLSAPPYTKQYVDDYRQRIKADPDPEAHFTYAKYLVDAAKKVGADAKDQRSVKKYRETLLQEALKVMRRLATQGSPYDEAQFYLANCYGTGLLGLQVDHERAYHLYLQAAKQNNAAASYRVAVCNEIGAGTRKEPARAAAFYRKAASLGDTAAMYKLGMILLDGALGEPKNPRDAVGWLKRAAEQADEANPHAVHELGLLHDSPTNGLVPYDPVYAKRLFTQAGQLGYTHSQFRLGQMYERGAPATPQDPKRSIAWYTKAAEKGHAEAELALSGWYLTGVEGVLKQSDSEAYLWARRAANKGLSKAEYAVGYYAEIGIGVRQDIEFAKRWYMRAAGMFRPFLLQLLS
jgi:TPR repeat protein